MFEALFTNNEQLITDNLVKRLSWAACVMLTLALLASPALADNECVPIGVDPSVNGSLADSYDCDDAAGTGYGSGVTYTADGDLTIDFTDVDADGTLNRTTIGGTGITLTGDGTESIAFDSATNEVELQNQSGMTGALLGVTTVNGNIVIDTEEMDADTNSAAGVTHGIYAESTGSGSIDITTAANVDALSGTNPASSIGIEAITTSGGIDITTGANVVGNEGAIRAISGSGNVSIETVGAISSGSVMQYGIQAATAGSGVLTLTLGDGVDIGNSSTGPAIDATTGTGDLIIDIVSTGSVDTVRAASGTGILAEAGGDMQIDIGSGRRVSGTTGLDLTAAGQITVNVNNGSNIFASNDPGEFAIAAGGAGSLILTNDGSIDGAINLSLENGYVFDNNGDWDLRTGGFSQGLDDAFLATVQRTSTLGAGTFNNNGAILFALNKEVILAQETSYVGAPGSVMEIPVRAGEMTSAGQTGCTPETVTVAGCLNLGGGETSGETSILITTPTPDVETDKDLFGVASLGILLVDVGGGESAAGHFVLDSDSENYDVSPLYGPVITTGEPNPLVHALLYNPDSQQHILATVPTEEGVEYATYIGEAMSIWHTTADAVVGRQSDLREKGGRGGWARLVSESSERDATLNMTTHGNTFAIDTDYDRDTDALVFGFDAAYGDNYVIGLHGGLIESETDYERTGNDSETEGAMAGIYGGWWHDSGVSVDAAVNFNFLTLDHFNSYEVSHSDIRTMGIRAEAAWKYAVSENFYVQPLATAAYVAGRIETLELRANDISFENEESQRAALGLRLGGDMDLSIERFTRLKYWLTARAWEEFAEDGGVNYATAGEPLSIEEDISESFEEVGLGASLTNAEGNVSVFLSGNLQSGDRTDSTNVTIGGRLRW